uniref:Uncharacterized protein n=1 Tax=viral metagenome TaxID=1070528 RepID=A0A6M3X523_9ZZZZ
MTLSEEQPIFLGHCIFCGARMYRINGKVDAIKPAPGCICKAKQSESDLYKRVMAFQHTARRKASAEDSLNLTNVLYIAGTSFYISQLIKDLSVHPIFYAAAMAVGFLEEDFDLEEFVGLVEKILSSKEVI